MKLHLIPCAFILPFLILNSVRGQSPSTVFTDRFDDPRQIYRGASLSISLSNEDADSELEVDAKWETEPNHCGSRPGRSKWATWQPPSDGVVEIEVTSGEVGFIPLVGLYTGKSFEELKRRGFVCGFIKPGETSIKIRATVFRTDTYEIAVAGENKEEGGPLTITLNLISAPRIDRNPSSVDATVGEAVEFTVGATGFGASETTIGGVGTPPPLRYQWKHAGTNLVNGVVTGHGPLLDGTRVDGATAEKLTLNNVQEGWLGEYSVVVSNEFGNSPSLPARLNLSLLPRIVTQPAGDTRDAGTPFSTRVTAVGKPVLQYQWQFKGGGSSDFANLPSMTTTNLLISAVTSANEGLYRVIVSNPVGSITSAEAPLFVIDPDIQVTRPPSQTKAVGEFVSFRVTASARNRANSELQYQWKFNGNNLENGAHPADPTVTVKVSGAASAGSGASELSLNRASLPVAGDYSVLVSVRNTGVSKASLPGTLTVLVVPPNDHFVNSTPILFPVTVPIEGYNIGGTAEAGEFGHAGDAAQRSVWWNWKVPDECSLTTVRLAEGSLSGRIGVYVGGAVKSLALARHQRQALDKVTFFSTSGTTYSIAVDGRNNAVGNVKIDLTQTTTVLPPQITKNCDDQIVLACDPCYLSVEVESLAPITYQWQKIELDAAGQIKVINPDLDPTGQRTTVTQIFPPNSTPEKLRIKISDSARPSDEGLYRILIDNCAGQTNSRIARVSLRLPPEIRQQPSDVLDVRECRPVSFSVVPAGCPPFSYQWRRDGVDIPGATSVPLSFPSVKTNDASILSLASSGYSVVVRNEYGSVTSRVARLTVDPLPKIFSHPSGGHRRDCTEFTFSVTADDLCLRPLSYQWQKGGMNLLRAGTVATGSDLKLVNLGPDDSGDYRVIVSNVAGSVTSRVATLTVHAGPWITNSLAQPIEHGKTKEGESVKLDIGAESCSPIRYQWFFSESVVPPLLSQWYPYTDRALSPSQRLSLASSITGSRIFIERTNVPVSGIDGSALMLTNYWVRTNSITVSSFGALPGATGSSLTLSNVSPLNSGYYLVTMTNDHGWTNSVLTRVTVYIPPPNDHYTNRITIPGTNTLVTGYNIFATRETNEPVHSSSQASARSIWYSWKAPNDPGFLTVDSQESSIRTILALYTNLPVTGALTNFAQAAKTSSGTRSRLLRIGLTDATQVQLAVDGISNEEGNVKLLVNYVVDPSCPVVERQPQDLAARKGSRVEFSAGLKEIPFVAYQWYFAPSTRPGDSKTVPPNSPLTLIPGASGQLYASNGAIPSPTLTLTNVTEANEGYYVVILSNKYCSSVRSEAARLTLGGIIRGLVKDATTGRPIPGAEVCGGDPTNPGANYYCTTTDVNGDYELYGIKPGSMRADFYANRLVVGLNRPVNFVDQSTFNEIELNGKKSGYYNYVNRQVVLQEGGIIRQEFFMSPVLLKGMRFVLNWGDRPADLDLQLLTPYVRNGQNVVVNRRDAGAADVAPFATFEYDVIEGGRLPESITIHQFLPGTYRLFANKFRAADAGSLTTSEAVLNIYTNSPANQLEAKAVYSIHIPESAEDVFWYVCDIDGDSKTVTIRSSYSRTSPSLLPNVSTGPGVTPGGGSVEPVLTPPLPTTQVPSFVEYGWIFGNEGTSTQRSPSMSFKTPGYKDVTLNLTNPIAVPLLTRQLVRTNYIRVTNDPPRLRIVGPPHDKNFRIDSPIPISVQADDTDSFLTNFRVFLNSQPFLTATSPGSQSATLSTNWFGLQISTNTITATVEDLFGERAAATPVIFYVTNEPPKVVLTTPAQNQLFRLGGQVRITAAASDVDTPIDKIEFFAGTPPRLIQTLKAPPDTYRWEPAITWVTPTEGNIPLGSIVHDVYGLTGSSVPVRIRVSELKGQILIIRNRDDAEIVRMTQYLEGDGITYKVLDQEGLTFDLISEFEGIIWADTGTPGLTALTIDLLRQAFVAGKHLYFIGDDLLAVMSRFPGIERDTWRDLTHLRPPRALPTTPVTSTLVDIDYSGETRLFGTYGVVFNGKYGTVEDFTPTGQIQGGTALNVFGETVLGRASGGDALVSFTDPVRRTRILTQTFRTLPASDDSQQEARRLLFRNAVWWLLNGSDCSFLDFYPDLPGSKAEPDPVQAGSELTYDIQLIREKTCMGKWVVVSNVFSAPIQFVRATNTIDFGASPTHTSNAVVFTFKHFDPAVSKINFTVLPLGRGTLTNAVSIWAGSEDNTLNNSAQIMTMVEGNALPPSLNLTGSSQGELLLSTSNLVAGARYALEFAPAISAAMTWQVQTVLTNNVTGLTLPRTNQQQYYRLRRE